MQFLVHEKSDLYDEKMRLKYAPPHGCIFVHYFKCVVCALLTYISKRKSKYLQGKIFTATLWLFSDFNAEINKQFIEIGNYDRIL